MRLQHRPNVQGGSAERPESRPYVELLHARSHCSSARPIPPRWDGGELQSGPEWPSRSALPRFPRAPWPSPRTARIGPPRLVNTRCSCGSRSGSFRRGEGGDGTARGALRRRESSGAMSWSCSRRDLPCGEPLSVGSFVPRGPRGAPWHDGLHSPRGSRSRDTGKAEARHPEGRKVARRAALGEPRERGDRKRSTAEGLHRCPPPAAPRSDSGAAPSARQAGPA